jgi:hypothetical protein
MTFGDKRGTAGTTINKRNGPLEAGQINGGHKSRGPGADYQNV